MPGIVQKINACGAFDGTYHNPLVGNGPPLYHPFNGSSLSSNGFWSKQRDDTSYNQLHKFWRELTTQARHKLLRIDKQTLFEHGRKNMYCSRCNGLLLEGFLQIVLYGKSLQQDATSCHYSGRATNNQSCGDSCNDNEYQYDMIDASIHPWGGLTTARDGTLTLLDCYIHSKSLKGLQNVFDSAHARERERKLLYPDACGGGGRGWISQGMTGYGRGHGTRETCALHTARLSVETLVDFWSALGEETRQSLLRMKDEDFIEKLMYRFDSKRFCRDCRRNVIREFKELKELKRTRKDPHCTSWFCVADSVFQYKVSHDTVQADWHQIFLDACGTYHHFEWAIGTGEGKSDILDFKNVGLSVRVQVNSLDLSGLSACYITLRAWRMDGRCNELCVKAHALRGQQCVHCRLAVRDGFVTITVGEKNIRRFFEQAEDAEEEEDDDSMDKEGNELEGECSRPQKHAKSPELAREFLLDAATVIFKEQVEKAFREGTARQNTHSIFISLALKLLEERLHVACKEIITLEKQRKLLEEEQKEKREEEERKERKERRRTREREKKLRRKERLREKENKEKICAESKNDAVALDTLNEAKSCVNKDINIGKPGDCACETGEDTPSRSPFTPEIQDDMGYCSPNVEIHPEDNVSEESCNSRDFYPSSTYNHHRYSSGKPRLHKDAEPDPTLKWSDRRGGAALSERERAITEFESKFRADGLESTRNISCFSKQLRTSAAKFNARNGPRLSEKLQCTNNRVGDRCDSHVCSCNHQNDYRVRSEYRIMRSTREPKYVNKLEPSCDVSKSYNRGQCTQVECTREINGRVKTNTEASKSPVIKKVWEPLDSQKKSLQSNSVALNPKVEITESDRVPESSITANSSELTGISVETNMDNELGDLIRSGDETCRDTENRFHSREKSGNYIKVEEAEYGKLCFMARFQHRTVDSLQRSSSNSDNCSSCLSEGDSNTSSPNRQSTSTSDSEELSQASDMLHYVENGFTEFHNVVDDRNTTKQLDINSLEPASGAATSLKKLPAETDIYCESGRANVGVNAQSESVLPTMMHNQNIYQIPAMGYYHQSPVSWPAGPINGLMSFQYPNHYLLGNTFGYDLNTNPQLMQYGGLQHLPPPSMNHVQVLPVFPPMTQANPAVVKEPPTVGSTDQHTSTLGAPDKGNVDFSLFHFGGPVALSAGSKAEEAMTVSAGEGNRACNRGDSIEEYNLFAASNGIKFSIM